MQTNSVETPSDSSPSSLLLLVRPKSLSKLETQSLSIRAFQHCSFLIKRARSIHRLQVHVIAVSELNWAAGALPSIR